MLLQFTGISEKQSLEAANTPCDILMSRKGKSHDAVSRPPRVNQKDVGNAVQWGLQSIRC